nr:MAG TPA: hypothetical protein [Caudoviricetes sp.]
MTNEEKLQVIKAYYEGKTIEVFTPYLSDWQNLQEDVWNFEKNLYRIKSTYISKFKVHDTLVCREDEGKPFPTIYTVKAVDGKGYTLDNGEFEKSPEIIEKEYVLEKEVLWYFEWKTTKGQFVKDFEVSEFKNDVLRISKNYRLSMDEAVEVVRNTRTLTDCYPMTSLGFRLRRDD